MEHQEGEEAVGEGPLPDHQQDLAQGSAINLTEAQMEWMRSLLEQYGDVFSRDDLDLGCTGVVTHVISSGDSLPIKRAPPGGSHQLLGRRCSRQRGNWLRRG